MFALAERPDADAPARLDRNESPHDWPLWAKTKVLRHLAALEWNRYPPADGALEERLARSLGVPPPSVLLGVGAVALIDLAVRAFGSGARTVVVSEPSFEQVGVFCAKAGLRSTPWPLDEAFRFTLESFPALARGPGLVLVASPNNPCGSVLPEHDLRVLLDAHPAATFVVDEAYGEFAGASSVALVQHHSNLLVLRSFSKGLSAAGVRLGYAVGQAKRIAALRAQATPFSVGVMQRAVATAVLEDAQLRQWLDLQRAQVIAERERLTRSLCALSGQGGFRCFPSSANFLLLDFGTRERALRAAATLGDAGVRVKTFGPDCRVSSCLRLSVGTPAENARLVKVLSCRAC